MPCTVSREEALVESLRNGVIVVGGRKTGRTALNQVLQDRARLVEQVRELQAENERLRGALADNEQAWVKCNREQGEVIEKVRALHSPEVIEMPAMSDLTWCSHCYRGTSWPCPTINALDGDGR